MCVGVKVVIIILSIRRRKKKDNVLLRKIYNLTVLSFDYLFYKFHL